MFLGTVATCTNWATDEQGNATECSLILDDIPFVDYVELPSSLSELRYSNILCGVIKGALEQVRSLTTTTSPHIFFIVMSVCLSQVHLVSVLFIVFPLSTSECNASMNLHLRNYIRRVSVFVIFSIASARVHPPN